MCPVCQVLEMTDHDQPDDRKWAHGARATGAPGEPNRKSQSWGPCWGLGRDRRPWVPFPNADVAPWGPQDKMLLCSEVQRITKQEREGCWSLPADPPRTLHRAVCAGGWPLMTESLRVLGFQLPSAKRGHTRPRSEGGRREGLLRRPALGRAWRQQGQALPHRP